MLLTITNTAPPATDLGYLLHKNPARLQSFDLSFGQAHVFYPRADAQVCTAALLLDVDPVSMVRGNKFAGSLQQYVNDRPYVASSFLSVAIAQVFGSALGGKCKDRPDVVNQPLPLTAALTVLPCRGDAEILTRLFTPLGYQVTAQPHALDTQFPAWGQSNYHTVTLTHTLPLQQLLTHLYVLVPVLDNEKHYWVGDEEVEKLLRFGAQWLAHHPERELITRRYLKYRHDLTRAALEQLAEEDHPDPDAELEAHAQAEAAIERPVRLHDQRLGAVAAALRASGARRVLDLGCGSGQLLYVLIKDAQFNQLTGVDVSHRALEIATDRLHLDRMSELQRQRVQLLHGSLNYRDQRLTGFDAAAVVEVIEHLDPPRLQAFGRVLFEFARPRTIVVTTPNVEYNVRFETLPAGQLRHRDHRFEWTRAQFHAWADRTAQIFGYNVRYLPIGPDDPAVGPPTQMAVFSLAKSPEGP